MGRSLLLLTPLVSTLLLAACAGQAAPTAAPAPTPAPPAVGTPTSAPSSTPTRTPIPVPFALGTQAFAPGDTIPVLYTCEGADVSPALSWTAPPSGTQTLALVADDPDAPAGTWDHWVVFNLPAELRELPEAQPGSALLPSGGVQGMNSFGALGYRGPCPPTGPAHTYRFFLYAVDQSLSLSAAASKAAVLAGLEGHVLGSSLITGTYQNASSNEGDDGGGGGY